MFRPIEKALLLICLCTAQQLFAQDFLRTEHLVGLADVSDNSGVSVADYDLDQDLDIFIVAKEKDTEGNEQSFSKLFRNDNNGRFTDVTEAAGLTNLLLDSELDESYETFRGFDGFKYGASWGDFDNDGYPDILFTHLAKVQLFHNQGNGTFVDITESSGILGRNECGNLGATWFDYNNDALLDLYIADWRECDGNTMYRNNGDGTFTDVSSIIQSNTSESYPSFVPFPFDFNNDGWMDLYVSNDLSRPNELFLNDGGNQFTDVANDYGVDVRFDDMGVAMSDFNNDGFFDIISNAIDQETLLQNNGTEFFDRAASNKINASGWAWGATFADLDLDCDEDLFIVNGFWNQARNAEYNVYYENKYANGTTNFDLDTIGIEDLAISIEVVDFDYDNDGDLDLIVSNSDRQPFFYDNQIITTEDNNQFGWLKISLEGTLSNRDAIGTTVKLNTSEGSYYRYYNGVGFLGQSLKPVHFGVHSDASITSLEIFWPSGETDLHTGVTKNTHIKATENNGFVVLDQNFAVKNQGCIDPVSCNYDPMAVVDDGSCQYLQVSGTISGNSNTGYFREETYSFPLQAGQNISWKVNGGHIISGWDTPEILVKWELEDQGRVTAVVSDENCSSEIIARNVNIRLSNIDPNTSIARVWNEATLYAIRNDFARPTVHARNLFHVSAAMFDVWAIYNSRNPYLIGEEINGFSIPYEDFDITQAQDGDVEQAMSYAAYRLLSDRFLNSPNYNNIQQKLNGIMIQLGYSITETDLDYTTGNPAYLGNYVANVYSQYGTQDGSNELNNYENRYYLSRNLPLVPILRGNPLLEDPNRWQPLSLLVNIDQSGNVIPGEVLPFLSPEWGNVNPFAMNPDEAIVYERSGPYRVYNDPGAPPLLGGVGSDIYQWGFSLVSVWSAHLDPSEGTMWDVSPGAIGNLPTADFPGSFEQFPQFYDLLDGGVMSQGHSVNPATGSAYEPQIVPRGDYTRVLAEYWADGPDSETPPGHWFTILNTVNDHPDLIRRLEGQGDLLTPLAWDVMAYFTLGGAMHDSAISAWGAKGWYDYIRPISAIRYMSDLGQSTSPDLPRYHPNGIPLIDGFIEMVEEGDELDGRVGENIGKIKVLAWRGHTEISDPETDQAGVGWILAESWWPYQRPSFVTPPFAGYVSGHSTFSRAAADILTRLTGDAYFPGGMGQFTARKNEFLVFEEGPSVDVVLQWATYRDASDQSSLSRIWGGIHPPMDDVPGRLMGEKVAEDAFEKALTHFERRTEDPDNPDDPDDPDTPIDEPNTEMVLYPNPIVGPGGELTITNSRENLNFVLYNIQGQPMNIEQEFSSADSLTTIRLRNLPIGVYFLVGEGVEWKIVVM